MTIVIIVVAVCCCLTLLGCAYNFMQPKDEKKSNNKENSANIKGNQQVLTTQSPTTTQPPTTTQLQQKVTFYEHCNYEGSNWNLDVGDYSWVENLGIPNEFLSAVRIPPGFQVTLYEDINFGGRQLTLTGDTPCLVNLLFNDVTSSIRIKRI